MSSKAFILVGLLIVALILIFWIGRGPNIPQPSDQARPLETDSMHPAGTGALPKVDSLTLAVQDAEGKDLPLVTMAMGEIKHLPTTPYSLRVTEFYTHWNWNKHAINLSREERNPAVKIDVLQNDSVLYYQWGFYNIPFFKMSGVGGHPGSSGNKLLFTLMSYQGVRFPDSNPAEKP